MKSPCVRLCTLNESNMCLGCARTLNEITSWASYSDEQRLKVIGECEKRLVILSEHALLEGEAKRMIKENIN